MASWRIRDTPAQQQPHSAPLSTETARPSPINVVAPQPSPRPRLLTFYHSRNTSAERVIAPRTAVDSDPGRSQEGETQDSPAQRSTGMVFDSFPISPGPFPISPGSSPSRRSSSGLGSPSSLLRAMTVSSTSPRGRPQGPAASQRLESGLNRSPESSRSRRPGSDPGPPTGNQKYAAAKPQVPLAAETAIAGRIVWVKAVDDKPNEPGSGIENAERGHGIREGAAGHPGVILAPAMVRGENDKVKVLLITSWEGKTVKEKWNRGNGVNLRQHYLLIEHDDEETREAKEQGMPTLALKDGKFMRKRCYICLRDDPYEYKLEDLSLYTDSLHYTDTDYFLTDQSHEELTKAYCQRVLAELARQ
ncbi:hypothetical protein MPH_01129 [Macrophomina phaseolina MS6]|uniref:Uncharacterized protein n=2 Tax=Macrophomina phaseolina TaxID=35725 RepID=K2SYB4_MACPH|nr:hypothetical protein MPH_01129 [Macrophomina phaseolina MS6]